MFPLYKIDSNMDTNRKKKKYSKRQNGTMEWIDNENSYFISLIPEMLIFQ